MQFSPTVVPSKQVYEIENNRNVVIKLRKCHPAIGDKKHIRRPVPVDTISAQDSVMKVLGLTALPAVFALVAKWEGTNSGKAFFTATKVALAKRASKRVRVVCECVRVHAGARSKFERMHMQR